MDWTNPTSSGDRSGRPETPSASTSAADKPSELRVRKRLTFSSASGRDSTLEVFTLSLGEETIELLPLKNWSQLDHYKWTARGKLPGEPAGLEIAFDHLNIAGETIAVSDPAGAAKLERLFNEWLHLERETQELSRQKAHAQPRSAVREAAPQPVAAGPRFRVEVDKRGQVHIDCCQGRDTAATIGLTVAGFNSLSQQGLMRKPRKVATGALHDWVELDGELFSFENGRNDTALLEKALNERYVPTGLVGAGLEVVIFQNAASPTGFDIQFPVMVAGVPHNQRQRLDNQSLELLQDQQRCGLMRNEIIVKLIPPNLVFKQRTSDGGEQYLAQSPDHIVALPEEEGRPKTIDLSQLLNLLRLNPAELTAVFGHPVVNRQAKAAPSPHPSGEPQLQPDRSSPISQAKPQPASPTPPPAKPAHLTGASKVGLESLESTPTPTPLASGPIPEADQPAPKRAETSRPLPNLWLSKILAQPASPNDWFNRLAYGNLAERFGNSTEGRFGPSHCWFVRLGESEDMDDPAFKGIFFTERGSLGFLNQGQLARFNHGVAFLGTRESALEGIDVNLVAVGLDSQERVLFVLSDNYRGQFGVPETALMEVVRRLGECGASIMSVQETLSSREPLEVVWTVPAEQADPENPEALESRRPSA